ncbi:flagellar hook protein FlgE [Nitrospira sp. Kam-Ns4a]
MLTALYAGLSGLDATGRWLQVISNNIANSATVGFKASRALFAEMVGSSYLRGGARGHVGLGTNVPLVTGEFTQGLISPTGHDLDLAIQGNGFFVVKDSTGNTFYTRAGQFGLDAKGRVVAPGGQLLQGYLADETGTITTTLGTLTTAKTTGDSSGAGSSGTGAITQVSSPPHATTAATIAGNLDASAAAITGGFDSADPSGTSTFATSLTVYDAQGAGHLVTVYFTKTGANAWAYNVVANGAVAGTGTLAFQDDGTQSGSASASASLTFGSGSVPVAFDFSGMTQYSRASEVTELTQDGYAAWSLEGVTVDGAGQVIARFSNGRTRALGQVALAGFINPQGLARTRDNLFEATTASGEATVGKPAAGGLGTIVLASLEQSNVDLSDQFVDMIAAQREYQANSRVITTTDELLVEVMSLKR